MTKFKGLLEAAKKQSRVRIGEARIDSKRTVNRRRPPGKRSDPAFEQITAYIKRDTHQAAKIALLQHGEQDFSELVERLLRQWLQLSK